MSDAAEKPEFDPSQSFEKVKPEFDPHQSFEKVGPSALDTAASVGGNILTAVGKAIQPYEGTPRNAFEIQFLKSIKGGTPPLQGVLEAMTAAKHSFGEKTGPTSQDVAHEMGISDDPIISKETAKAISDHLGNDDNKKSSIKSFVDFLSNTKRSDAVAMINDLMPGPISMALPAAGVATEGLGKLAGLTKMVDGVAKPAGIVANVAAKAGELAGNSYTVDALQKVFQSPGTIGELLRVGKIPMALVMDLAGTPGGRITQSTLFAASRMADSDAGKKILQNYLNSDGSNLDADAVTKRFQKRK